jgi:transposase
MNWQSCSRQPREPDRNRAKDHQRSAISSRISSRSIMQKSRYHLVSAPEWRDAYWRDSRIQAVQPLRAGNRMGASLVRCPERASKSSSRSGVIPAESRATRKERHRAVACYARGSGKLPIFVLNALHENRPRVKPRGAYLSNQSNSLSVDLHVCLGPCAAVAGVQPPVYCDAPGACGYG